MNDFSAGASVDTLRRNIIRYDAPRFSGLWGNVDLSAAWGEDDFFDVAVEHGINYNDWKFRFGAGYLHDTTEGALSPATPSSSAIARNTRARRAFCTFRRGCSRPPPTCTGRSTV